MGKAVDNLIELYLMDALDDDQVNELDCILSEDPDAVKKFADACYSETLLRNMLVANELNEPRSIQVAPVAFRVAAGVAVAIGLFVFFLQMSNSKEGFEFYTNETSVPLKPSRIVIAETSGNPRNVSTNTDPRNSADGYENSRKAMAVKNANETRVDNTKLQSNSIADGNETALIFEDGGQDLSSGIVPGVVLRTHNTESADSMIRVSLNGFDPQTLPVTQVTRSEEGWNLISITMTPQNPPKFSISKDFLPE